jgi:hypothetical protein
MMMQTTIYRDHELVVQRESRGWRVRISGTDRRTGLHPHPFAAFVEARAQVDTLCNRGARQPIWISGARKRPAQGLMADWRQLAAWCRAALTGRPRRA